MATLLRMPSLSPTMESGVVVEFKKAEGEYAEMGEVFAEIETDKAVMEYELVYEGYVKKLLVETGKELQVGDPIAILAETMEEDISACLAESKQAIVKQAIVKQDIASQDKITAQEKPEVSAEIKTDAPQPTITAVTQDTTPLQAVANGAEREQVTKRTKISPYARKLAQASGLNWQGMIGRGAGGRVIAADIEVILANSGDVGLGASGGMASTPAAAEIFGNKPHIDVPLGMMRKAIGRKMVESKTSAPHFQVNCTIAADGLVEIRSQLKQALPNLRVSVNDFVMRACAIALAQHPEMNSHLLDGFIRRYRRVDLAVAVATEEGLLTPIIEDVAQKSLVQLGSELRGLAKKAQARQLKPEEYTGGTFTVSNLGMFGVDGFNAILNVPQVGILAVAAILDAAVVRGGKIEVGKTMNLTLSCDHRAVDGINAACFMATIRSLLEAPAALAF